MTRIASFQMTAHTDPIMPVPLNSLMMVSARQTVPFWLDIDTKGLKPGKHKGFLIVYPSYSGFKGRKIAFELTVCGIDLGKIQNDQSSYNYSDRNLKSKDTGHFLVKYGINYLHLWVGNEKMCNIYPKVDAKGNILKQDFSHLDKFIKDFIAAGIPAERVKLFFCFGLNMGYYTRMPHNGKAQLKYMTPEWKKAFSAWFNAFVKHLKAKGINYNRFVLCPMDEPQGLLSDPKSTMHMAFKVSKLMKNLDPKVRIMLDPKITSTEFEKYSELFKVVDILQPYRPFLDADPEVINLLNKTGKEIWTYHVLQKTNFPVLYRRMFWQNLKNGFTSVNAFWMWGEHAGGDGFNSYDYKSPRRKNSADYGVVYSDFDHGKVIPSRRLEAWYQGQLDFKAATLCQNLIKKLKTNKKSVAAYEHELNNIISIGGDCTIEEQNHLRERLLKLALKLKAVK